MALSVTLASTGATGSPITLSAENFKYQGFRMVPQAMMALEMTWIMDLGAYRESVILTGLAEFTQMTTLLYAAKEWYSEGSTKEMTLTLPSFGDGAPAPYDDKSFVGTIESLEFSMEGGLENRCAFVLTFRVGTVF